MVGVSTFQGGRIMRKVRVFLIGLLVAMLACGLFLTGCEKKEAAKAKVRIAMVVKNLGNSFFEACRDRAPAHRPPRVRSRSSIP
jgi:ABC-type sugar transport system substrate-binding protein